MKCLAEQYSRWGSEESIQIECVGCGDKLCSFLYPSSRAPHPQMQECSKETDSAKDTGGRKTGDSLSRWVSGGSCFFKISTAPPQRSIYFTWGQILKSLGEKYFLETRLQGGTNGF